MWRVLRNLKAELPYDPENASASLVAQMVKNLPAMQETRLQSLGLEDPLAVELLFLLSLLLSLH